MGTADNLPKAPVSVIVLTYNEEVNIKACLESVKDLTEEVFIVDSFSTDKTLEIARQYTERIYQNPWVHFAHQRNWALDNLPITNDWVFFLDADERLTLELCREIVQLLPDGGGPFDGFYIKRNFWFLGRWLKHGGYQSDYILRLIRKDKGRVIGIGVWEYVTFEGRIGKLRAPMLHEDKKNLSFWIEKHNKYSSLEAQEVLKVAASKELAQLSTGQETRKIEHGSKIWLRQKIWARLPILFRPLGYFFYRYFFQLGFLDGKEGLIFCFLHGFWFPFLVDAKIYELTINNKQNETNHPKL